MVLGWLWKGSEKGPSSSKQQEGSADDLIEDPSLKDYYQSSKPLTPISLAPEEVKKEYEREQEAAKQSQKGTFKAEETGLHQITDHEENKTGLPLGQAARNNCVEYEALMAHCSLKGTYWERLNMCHKYRKQQMKCVDLQTEALNELGYTRAYSDDQRTEIQYKVDDIFSKTVPDGPISDETVKKFEAEIKKEKLNVDIYRA
ncbi:hypothetical protein TRVA0_045S00430 [Trichomonascus vanleenenianus]|uniref:uncharacterized protein n=1 Tax=Trichomonascus vanleenenianus TaxID=2268995 RepID=UPI003ECAACB5